MFLFETARSFFSIRALLALMIFVNPAYGSNEYSLTILHGHGADHNLRELPADIIAGNINWDDSYFSGISLERDLGLLSISSDTMPIRHGLELIAIKHRGLQDNAEIGLAYKLKSPVWTFAKIETGFDFGMGISHASSDPNYEDGPLDDPTARYKTQLLLLFDSRWRLKANPRYSLLLRVHHRSGAYGAIAPRNVGSNFLSIGLGYDF